MHGALEIQILEIGPAPLLLLGVPHGDGTTFSILNNINAAEERRCFVVDDRGMAPKRRRVRDLDASPAKCGHVELEYIVHGVLHRRHFLGSDVSTTVAKKRVPAVEEERFGVHRGDVVAARAGNVAEGTLDGPRI